MTFLARFVTGLPVGGEHLDQLAPLFGRECPDDTHVGQISGVVVQTEQQRPDLFGPLGRGGLVPAKSANYELRRAFVFDLHHHPLPGDVSQVRRLGHHAVKAGTLETAKPIFSHCPVACGRRHVDAAGLPH